MRQFRFLVASALASIGTGAIVRGQSNEPDLPPFIIEDMTFDADRPYGFNFGVIGYPDDESRRAGENGTSPTVNIAATISTPFFDVFNSSTLNRSGGTVTIDTFDTARANITGGVGNLVAFDNSVITMSGGTATTINSGANSTVNVTGGTVRFLNAQHSSRLTASGLSDLNTVSLGGGATLTLSGSSLSGAINALNNATGVFNTVLVGTDFVVSEGTGVRITMSNGAIGRSIIADGGDLSFSGVDVGSGVTVSNTTLTMQDGTIVGGITSVESNITLLNQTVSLDLFANGNTSVGLVDTDVVGRVSISGIDELNLTIGDAELTTAGGSIGTDLVIGDRSDANVNSTTVGRDLLVRRRGAATLSSVSVARDLSATGDAAVIMTGGAVAGSATLGDRAALDASGVSIVGNVSVNSVAALDLSTGSRIGGDLTVSGTAARAVVSDSDVDGDVSVAQTAFVTLDDATVGGDVLLTNTGRLEANGGSIVGGIAGVEFAHITVVNQTVGGSVAASGVASINLLGTAVAGDVELTGASTLVLNPGTLVAGLTSVSDNATLQITGGVMGGETGLSGDARLTMLAGQLRILNVTGNASAAVTGGFNDSGLTATDDASVFWGSAGEAGSGAHVSGSARIFMSAGSFSGDVTVIESGELDATGVAIDGNVANTGNTESAPSRVMLGFGSTVGGHITASGFSFTFSDAIVGGNLTASESTSVFLGADGSIAGNLEARDGSLLNIQGVALAGQLTALNDSTVAWFDGNGAGAAVVRDNASLRMFDGAFAGVQLFDQANFSMDGDADFNGTVRGNLSAEGVDDEDLSAARIALRAGTVEGDVELFGTRKVQVNGTRIEGGLLMKGAGNEVQIDGESFLGGGIAVANGGKLFIGGSVTVNGGVGAVGNAEVEITSGTVNGDISALGESQISVGAATLTGPIDVFSAATVRLQNTTVSGDVTVNGDDAGLNLLGPTIAGSLRVQKGNVDMVSGSVKILSVEQSGNAVIRNGTVQAYAQVDGDDANLELQSGARVGLDLVARGNADVLITGGRIDDDFEGSGDSDTVMYSGRIDGDVRLSDRATLTMRGGELRGRRIVVSGSARFELEAGQLGAASGEGTDFSLLSLASLDVEDPSGLIALDTSTINIYGTDLIATLIEPNFLEGAYSLYRLDGMLSNGALLGGATMLIANDSTATYNLLPPVPEPGNLALAASASALLWCRRRRMPVN